MSEMTRTVPTGPRPAAGGLWIEWLDGVRALAATFVVLHHTWLMTVGGYPGNNGPWWTDFLVYGHLAVAVFIVVSGFSLALGPARHAFTLPRGNRDFYRRRLWRIIPPYWAALVLSCGVIWLGLVPTSDGAPLGLRDALIHLALVQDALGNVPPNGTFWSIAIEVHIYLFFPLLLLLARRLPPAAVGLLVAGLVIALHVAGGFSPALAAFSRFSPQFFVLFTFGMLAVRLATRHPRAPLGWPTAVLLLALLSLLTVVGPEAVVGAYFWVDLLVGLTTALVLALLATRPMRPLKALLEVRTLRWAGTFAFSLYLVHAPVLELVRSHFIRPTGLSGWAAFATMLVVGVPLAFALAYGFFLVFERPFLQVRSFTELRSRLMRPGRSSSSAAFDLTAERRNQGDGTGAPSQPVPPERSITPGAII